jgi:DNA-directed RNA polymerase subunit omega
VARVTVEDCLEKVNNRFALVHVVAKRTKQMMKGSPAVVTHKENKTVVTALREVAASRVGLDLDPEQGSLDFLAQESLKG